MPFPDHFRQLALSFPETTEQPHFEKPSFRVGKKIFATLNMKEQRATLKLSERDQDLFTLYDRTIIYPVPNNWGQQGWTHVDLTRVPEEMLKDALTAAYCEVAPARLATIVKPPAPEEEF
ncbi:MmcQ/YjbR family DNA-binding protein [Telluribacter sp.]|jgi:predicted DNA-binding protein (MmcQ/YjbR family)|uniref:MmcQ/YjbR family DNA-binding protein n=1 Tax=Telluribacter sp. TaxID=1978767 RepID=UPI002E0F0F61|nr:MmcQ/YjbR family DNA-binding protein [Telluribacter sp.]